MITQIEFVMCVGADTLQAQLLWMSIDKQAAIVDYLKGAILTNCVYVRHA